MEYLPLQGPFKEGVLIDDMLTKCIRALPYPRGGTGRKPAETGGVLWGARVSYPTQELFGPFPHLN